MTTPPPMIPALLLKTRSQPHDAYEEYFAGCRSSGHGQASTDSSAFVPEFVPVLEHRPNTKNLGELEELLRSGRLSDQYGGMIFTSQRAVEAWADVVERVDRETEQQEDNVKQRMNAGTQDTGSGVTEPVESQNTPDQNSASVSKDLLDDDFAFPLYTVGPATSRALNTLVGESSPLKSSPFSRLRPSTFGEHTGNGENLAQYILSHYNTLHSQRLYTFYEAPRLPFTPLIGPSRGERIEKDDARIQKKPLLFLVGEQRRDIIPKTLMDQAGKLAPEERIQVDEVEVYVTAIMESFQDDFRRMISSFKEDGIQVVVVVVFSPQGCESMLQSLGYLDADKNLTDLAKTRWEKIERDEGSTGEEQTYIIVAIGPTTRDHLKNQYGFDADVCAAKPSPEGVGNGLMEFLKQKGLR